MRISDWSSDVCSSDLAFDVDLGTFLQILAGDLAELAGEHDVVPLRHFLLLTSLLVLPAFGGGDGGIGDRIAGRKIADLGIFAEIADQDDFIDATGHDCLRNVTG